MNSSDKSFRSWNMLSYSVLTGLVMSGSVVAQSADIALVCGNISPISITVRGSSASVNGKAADKLEITDTTLRVWMDHPDACHGQFKILDYHDDDQGPHPEMDFAYWSLKHDDSEEEVGTRTVTHTPVVKINWFHGNFYCGDVLYVVDRYSAKGTIYGALRSSSEDRIGPPPDQKLFDREDKWNDTIVNAESDDQFIKTVDCARSAPKF